MAASSTSRNTITIEPNIFPLLHHQTITKPSPNTGAHPKMITILNNQLKQLTQGQPYIAAAMMHQTAPALTVPWRFVYLCLLPVA